MKHIVKNPEPKELLDWKCSDKMYLRGKPRWNRLPSIIKDILRKKISNEQGYICCYCERRLIDDDFHLEHLMPKDISKFPEKQLDYNNLLCSCQLELEKGEPRHCGNSKGSWFQEINFVSPLNPNCENKFKYTFDGHIEPSDINDTDAVTTIEKLQLDKLNKSREKAIEPFIDGSLTDDDLRNLVNGYLVNKDNNDGKYNEFYTTIKYLFDI